MVWVQYALECLSGCPRLILYNTLTRSTTQPITRGGILYVLCWCSYVPTIVQFPTFFPLHAQKVGGPPTTYYFEASCTAATGEGDAHRSGSVYDVGGCGEKRGGALKNATACLRLASSRRKEIFQFGPMGADMAGVTLALEVDAAPSTQFKNVGEMGSWRPTGFRAVQLSRARRCEPKRNLHTGSI